MAESQIWEPLLLAHPPTRKCTDPPFEDCFFSGIVPVHFNVSGVRGTKLRGQIHVVSPAWLPLTENTPGVGGRGKRNRHLCCLPLRKMQVASVDKKLFAPQFAGKEAHLDVNVATQRAHKVIVASQGFNWTKNKLPETQNVLAIMRRMMTLIFKCNPFVFVSP